MKKYLKDISPYVLIIFILIGLLIFTKECSKGKKCPEPIVKIITETKIEYDTIEITKTIYKPLPKDTIYITILEDIDTLEILKDYYSKKYYYNVYLDDTTAYIATKDTIYQNEIYSSELTFINRRPTIINTTTIHYDTCKPCSRFNIGFGGFIGVGVNEIQAGPSVMLTTNKKSSYTLSYDIINKVGQVGVYYNIK